MRTTMPSAWRAAFAAAALAVASGARADTLSCDMTQYKASQGLTAAAAADTLTVT